MGSLTIPDYYIQNFSKNWDIVVQQMMSKLGNRVTVDSFGGKEKVYNDLDSVAFVERTGRLTQSNPLEVTGDKRKMTKRDFKCQYEFDRKDKEYLEMLNTPQSELMDSMKAAWNRKIDDLIIEAASGTVYGGAAPYVTPSTFDTANRVAVDFVVSGSTANSGLTPQKIQQTAKLIGANDLDMGAEQFFLFIGPRQILDLWQYVQSAPNAPFASHIADALTNGKKLFGFNVVESNRLTRNVSTDVRTCLAFSQKGIYVAPDAFTVRVDEMPQRDHALQVAAYADYGCMRRYDKRVYEIYCDESP